GTSGKPKGVMIEQQSVVNYVYALDVSLGERFKRVDFSANYCFDLAVTTTICPLLLGGCVYVYAGDISDAGAYQQHLVDHNIGLVKTTPSLAQMLLLGVQLDTLILGGEALTQGCIDSLSVSVGSIFDEYGPTEATVGAMVSQVWPPHSSDSGKKGIGKPYPNVRLFNLNAQLKPVPTGAPGELYIGGDCLARGYLNRDDLTNERFITYNGERVYKTGDRVRWQPDGHMHYLGRNDNQVKIRGFRIELGEIESVLLEQPGVEQAAVMVRNQNQLAAYVVGEIEGLEFLPDILSEQLPEHMVPSTITPIDTLPLTSNGKLDYAALPNPGVVAGDEYTAPRSSLERTLCEIWQEVLKVERVGVDDNFFRIGGDSIVCIGLVSRLRAQGFTLQVKAIFAAPTVAQLARLLESAEVQVIETEQGILTGEFDLLPVQQWFFEKRDKNEFAKSNHWNQSFVIRVPELDSNQLESYVEELVECHDILRAKYVKTDNEWKQIYQSEIEIPKLKTLDVSKHESEEIEQILTDWQSGFDLEKGAMFQAGYLYGYKDGSARIYFALHHLMVDGVSWRILTDDLKTLFDGKKLPLKGSSYGQWTEKISRYATEYASEETYWTEQLKALPDYQSVYAEQISCEVIVEFDKEVTQSLLKEASMAYNTELNDLLLTSLAYTLNEV
ncbi:MAG: AMP-binding protein, partial [Psychrosphaera sp.]|nr:AMP-binding protein [Psychrosphaera sp.]